MSGGETMFKIILVVVIAVVAIAAVIKTRSHS